MPTPAPPQWVQNSIAATFVLGACEVAWNLRGFNRERIASNLGSGGQHFDLPSQFPDALKEKPDPLAQAAGLGAGAKHSDNLWEYVGANVGVSPDILKLLFLLVISTPLSLPFPRLRASLIHIYSILTSVIFLTQVLDLKWGLLQLVGASLVTWALVKQGRGLADEGKSQGTPGGKGKRMPWVVFGLMMAHLTINHYRRIILNIPLHVVEITGAHMVLVMKLTSFAWSAYDGSRPLEELDSYQASQRIVQVPGLLEFFGYVLFFPSLLVGPAFSFAQYRAFSNRTLYPAAVTGGKIPPGRFTAAGRNLVAGLIAMGLYAFFAMGWSYETILTDEFLQKNAAQRFIHLMIAGFMARTKYYIVWSLSEAAFNVSGAGYDSHAHKWIAGQNIDIPKIELAQNYKGLFDSWNMRTNVWLRESVYKRVAKKGKKPGFKSTMATFGTSALWHGPHTAYFFAFFMGGFLQSLGRHIRTSVRPFFLPPGTLGGKGSPDPTVRQGTLLKTIYDVICVFNVQATLNYIVIPFLLVDVPASIEAYRRLGWYGHIMTFAPLAVFWLGGGSVLKSFLREREAKVVVSASGDVDAYEKRVEEKLGKGSAGVYSVAPVPEEAMKMNGKSS